MSLVGKIWGDSAARTAKRAAATVAAINAQGPGLAALSVDELKQKTAEFKRRLAEGADLEQILPEAFAVVREAATRTLGQRHYDVQLVGGLEIHRGKIVEMRTGEGKTLVCTLPAYLNALTGEGVHVVTVNDYLARRDAVWMGQIYTALGLSVGVINHESSYLYDPAHQEQDAARDAEGSFRVFHQFLKPCSRREAYLADITYGTNNEFGFDYLRDNLAATPERVVQANRHHFAIVDEVDSILIDEARTPLIISAPVGESGELYQTFAKIAATLERGVDFEVEEKHKAVTLTESGINKAEKALGVENIYTDRGIKYVHHLETAVRAKALFERDREYVVKDNEVIIVDEFTGRLQPGRRWSEGLHQAIEAKEKVRVKEESRTFASITFQNYFKLYRKLAGMTGTALTSAEEFLRVYGLETISVPTHRPSRRQDLEDQIFQTEAGKLKAIARKIKELHERGQPVLVGTVSIEKNELVSAYLAREGVPHKILNAKNHEAEGEVIANAGAPGSVVIATNMAGRGVDIKLGGALGTPLAAEAVRNLGGLFVLGTERHEARRIDNQLRGRSGRQGDPGVTQFFISFDDDLARVFASPKVKGMMARFGIAEDEPIAHRLISRSIETAQTKVEGFNFDRRKHLLDYDNVLNHQRQIVYGRRAAVLFGGAAGVDEFLDRAFAEADLAELDLAATEKLLEAKKTDLGERFAPLLRALILQVIDLYWVEHLETMEYLRGSVSLRGYAQRDPLVEYKREGLAMFKRMEQAIFTDVLKLLPQVGLDLKAEAPRAVREVHEAANLIGAANQHAPTATPAKAPVGRNDPCPCGSGKKYKKCHGQ